MELELRLEGLAEEMVEAVADVQVVDLATPDAPGGATVTSGPFALSPGRATVLLSVQPPLPEGAYEPGVVVRVRGRTGRGARISFLNTRSTALPAGAHGPVAVALTRIT